MGFFREKIARRCLWIEKTIRQNEQGNEQGKVSAAGINGILHKADCRWFRSKIFDMEKTCRGRYSKRLSLTMII